jgi:membrane-associated phospholipid phosphatase
VLATLVLGGALFAVCYRLDPTYLGWQKTLSLPGPEEVGGQVLSCFKAFGEIVTVGAIITLIAIYDPRRRAIIIALLVAELLGNGIYSTVKSHTQRERPRSMLKHVADPNALQPAETWIALEITENRQDARSFPSGHSASAFALAGVLMWYYRRAAALFWTLAVGCVLSRSIVGAHWPTDIVAGAMLGYLCALVGVAAGDWFAVPHSARAEKTSYL